MSDGSAALAPLPLARSPIAHSPATVLDGWEVSARAATGASTLSDETPLAKVLVRAPFDGPGREALGVGFGARCAPTSGPERCCSSVRSRGVARARRAEHAPRLRTALEERLAYRPVHVGPRPHPRPRADAAAGPGGHRRPGRRLRDRPRRHRHPRRDRAADVGRGRGRAHS